MPVCFLCKESITSVNGLFVHLNIKHTDSFAVFKCGENGCHRNWSSWNSLRRHLLGSFHNFPAWPSASHSMSNTLTNRRDTQTINEPVNNDSTNNEDAIENIANDLISSITYTEFEAIVKQRSDAFVAKLYNIPLISRKHIQSIIEDSSVFLINGHISIIKEKVLSHFNALDFDSEIVTDIRSMFDCLENQFDHLRNDYQRLAYFKFCGNYIAPVPYCIGQQKIPAKIETCIAEKVKEVYGYFIPLRQVLQKFFELPGAFDATISYIRSLENSDGINNFIQSKLWRSKRDRFDDNEIVLPLFVYYDDWEVNNPLGTHCTCIGGVYCYIPCLPPECISRLENLFLVLLFKSQDRKNFGNAKTFAPLIEELNYLEQVGIKNTINGHDKHIYFVLGLLLGDNLGLHSICGFVESFRANYACRFCKLHRNISETTCFEDTSVLRTRESYDADVALKTTQLTGIKEECVFNTVSSFHIMDNIYVDMMHDVLEGIAHYDMIPIINHFIEIGAFTLSSLNYSVLMFDYGPHAQNKAPIIADNFATKSKLKMTASEMLNFCRLFGIIIGHTIKTYEDPFWKLYLLLKEIIEFLYNRTVSTESASVFKILVAEHHTQYIKCTNQCLKPKYHNLTHYSNVMMQSGPIILLSVIRLEGFHKALKKIANSIMSRKNITLSIATRHQLSFCYRLMAQQSIVPTIEVGSGQFSNITEHDHFNLFASSLPKTIISNPCCFIAHWINYKGTRYQARMVLAYGTDDSCCPWFAEIEFIVIYENNPVFICSSILNIGLNYNIGGFEVKRGTQWLSIQYDDLLDPFPLFVYTTATGEKYIVLNNSV